MKYTFVLLMQWGNNIKNTVMFEARKQIYKSENVVGVTNLERFKGTGNFVLTQEKQNEGGEQPGVLEYKSVILSPKQAKEFAYQILTELGLFKAGE